MAELAPGLEPGIERSDEFTVAPPLVADVGGTIAVGTHERRVVEFNQFTE
jgi:hypothetical protein